MTNAELKSYENQLRYWSDETLAEQLKNNDEEWDMLYEQSRYAYGDDFFSICEEMDECKLCSDLIEVEIGRRIDLLNSLTEITL